MLIRLGYDMLFDTPSEVPIVTLLNVHPSRKNDLREPDFLHTDPVVNIENYHDTFGNHGCRLVAPPGRIRLHNSTLIEDSGKPDIEGFDAPEIPIEHLPHEVLPFLMNSRYCEVDLLSNTASELFGGVPKGWQRVREVCTWVHKKVTFGYEFANPTRTALGVGVPGVGMPGAGLLAGTDRRGDPVADLRGDPVAPAARQLPGGLADPAKVTGDDCVVVGVGHLGRVVVGHLTRITVHLPTIPTIPTIPTMPTLKPARFQVIP